MSKIKNLKAIHNLALLFTDFLQAGFSVSKIKNLKAIHNHIVFVCLKLLAGFSVSKIKNLKAIHNYELIFEMNPRLVSACQR